MLKEDLSPHALFIRLFFKKAQLMNLRVLRTAGVALCTLSMLTLTSCDQNHTAEYERIDRSDIEGYEAFVREYPSSIHVSDAQERIQVAKEEIRMREEEERIREEAERRQRERRSSSESSYTTPMALTLSTMGLSPTKAFMAKTIATLVASHTQRCV